MTTIWRLNIKTAANKGVNPRKFCLDKNILGIGWRISKSGVTSWNDYISEASDKYKKYGRKFSAAINAIKHRMKIGDLCWTRDHDGIYYIGRINGDWSYVDDFDHLAADVVNIRSCSWHKVGTVDVVPGKIVNSYISGSTVQQVCGGDIKNYSQYLINKLSGNKLYLTEKSTNNIINLISSEDCEDLVALYMQKECGYICIPSSCKSDTAVYEYVMKHHISGEKAVAQVKHGDIDLNRDNYSSIGCKVFLFTTRGKYIGNENKNIICLNPDDMIDFAKKNYPILPDRIQHWLDFEKNQNK